ncbi:MULTISPECIES: zinc-ribbon domain-containing protein [Actinomycetes]|uniref:zinc-ribbon domain-containing protein n=1 Tax=Actinomycetes TaxID=1760 RepID=UPI0009DEAEBB
MASAHPLPGMSLADIRPEIAEEWHPTKNKPLTPHDVKPASAKLIWWLCVKGHAWQTKPQNRLRGERCPECSKHLSAIKRAQPKPGKSLADLYPEVAADWHPTHNGDWVPSDVNPGSKTKRWWRCATCAFEWDTDPDHRTRSRRGCPECGRRRVSAARSTPAPGQSLAERHPHLIAEWHPERNDNLTPFECAPKSHRKVWWKCPFGHEWFAEIAPRSSGVGCPKCKNTGASERQIRLAYELEAAGYRIDHDYPPIPVDTRRRPVRADVVFVDHRMVIEYDGAHYHQGGDDADLLQSAALTSAGWRVLRVRERPLRSLGGDEVFVDPNCSIKTLTNAVLSALNRLGFSTTKLARYLVDDQCWATDLADVAVYRGRSHSVLSALPDIAGQWHPDKNGTVNPDGVHPGSNTSFWWRCETCGHEWKAAPATRAAGRGCSVCGHRRGGMTLAAPRLGESLLEVDPILALEWHPKLNDGLKPADVKPFSARTASWQCKTCTHVWTAAVSTRSNGHGCPACARREQGIRRATPEVGRSFGDLYPKIAQEWHPANNEPLTAQDVKAFSMKNTWWRCKAGHEWQAPIAGRSRGEGCPPCAYAARGIARSTPRPGESVADRFPGVAKQWHATSNEQLTAADVKPGSSKHLIWWKCEACGHEWQATAKDRCVNGRGCPPCGRKATAAARAKPKPGHSLADLYPDIAAQWHPTLNQEIRPETTKPGSSKQVWWLCVDDHEWHAVPKSRTGLGSGCPTCARKRQAESRRNRIRTPPGDTGTEG